MPRPTVGIEASDLGRLRAGEWDAVAELYDLHHQRLRAFAHRLLGDVGAAAVVPVRGDIESVALGLVVASSVPFVLGVELVPFAPKENASPSAQLGLGPASVSIVGRF